MKTLLTKHLTIATALLLFPSWALASTVISFSNQTVIDTTFPTITSSGMHSGPTATTNIHSQNVVELIAGDLTLTNVNRQGRLTLYSTNTYSSGLDFITTDGLSLTFSNTRLDTLRGTTWGKIGITSANTNSMASANGIYLFFNRAGNVDNNTVELIQAVGGTETTLATLISGNVGSMFDAQTFTLSLTATNWSMTLVSQGATGNPTMTNSASGIFGTAWTTNNWGVNTYLGLEAYQQNTTADDRTRYAQLTVGSIQFETIPEPGTTALLLGTLTIALVGIRLRRKKS